jgi:rhodanese-related sulfurtransferase
MKQTDVQTKPSLVAEHPPASRAEALRHLEEKLALTCDAADVAEDLANGVDVFVVIDARSAEAFAAGHIPGALNIPHRTMTAESTAHLDRGRIMVVYCDGIGCNASIKGAYRMTQLGFRTKELLGGLDWWRRDGFEVHTVAGGGTQGAAGGVRCGC